MIFKVWLLYLWCLILVQGFLSDDSMINCTKACYSVAKFSEQYFYVKCITGNSQTLNNITNLNKAIQFKRYSGYAAVAAKIRFYREQRESRLHLASELHLDPNHENSKATTMICVLKAITSLLLLILLCLHAIMLYATGQFM